MSFIYLLSSIMAESVGKTVDKLNFRRNRVAPRNSLLIGFVAMTVLTGGYIAIVKQPAMHLTFEVACLLAGVAIFSFIGNVFDETSLKTTDLSEREPMVDFEPVLAGLIGYLIFPAERRPAALFAFILGALIVRWGIHGIRLKKSHRKGIAYLLIAVCFYAVLPSLYKAALEQGSPAQLAFFRAASVLLLISLFFAPKRWRGFTVKRVQYGLFAGIFYAVGAITSLYAIKVYGVVLTMLFLMLGPALRYLAGQFILGEKVRRIEVLSSLMLTIVVAFAAFAH